MVEYIVALMLLAGPTEPTAPAPILPKAPEVAEPTAGKLKVPASTSAAGAPAAALSGAKSVEKADETAELTAPTKAVTPPALAKNALCGELSKSGKELAAARKKLDDDRKTFEGEKGQLEKLAADIAQSRASLRAETERLETLLNKKGDAPAAAVTAEKPKTVTPAAAPLELDSLAKTMKSMKPEAAAALIQRTEQPLAAALLKRMKPAEAGAVMDRLKPDLAAELVAMMATMPGTPAKGGKP